MADYFDSLWDALKSRLSTVLSDATVFYRATQGRRINWRAEIESGGLVPPFVVVDVGTATASEDGPATGRAHDVPILVYYVRKGVLAQSELATFDTVERALEKKGKDIVDALLDETSGSYQVFSEPTVDSGSGNPANRQFIEDGANVIAVEVSFTALVGEVV